MLEIVATSEMDAIFAETFGVALLDRGFEYADPGTFHAQQSAKEMMKGLPDWRTME